MIDRSIKRLVAGEDLARGEMQQVFGEIMDGEASDVQKSAFLVALRMKGETADEITGAAMVMRERVTPLEVENNGLVDTCGTGGDGRGTINVSTIAALVVAGAGGRVAKHGNRAVSSRCGSADLLEALGVNIDLNPAQMAAVLDRVGIAFLFAPKLHPAMASVASVRKELGVRTVFNVLGPLTNPAFAKRQVLGVFAPSLVETVGRVLYELGTERALVVHGRDGLDEISLSSSTFVAEVDEGDLRSYEISPEDFGIDRISLDSVTGGDAAENAAIARRILEGEKGPARELIAVNAGAALYAAGLATDLRNGATLARETIDSGAAREKLEELVRATAEEASR
ncbi:MAG: anthranilate phosphoribosyltransferase [Thermoanaerobaculia bacterium]|nr:anthranilate phosphoribosyltransferase [Thermoanaerobaculia bacterium]